MKYKLLLLSLFLSSFFSCTTSDIIENDDINDGKVTITVSNVPFVYGGGDVDTRGLVDSEYKFLFTNKDSIGIFPEGGYQIPFDITLPEGETRESVSIVAEGWNTKVGKKYAAYYPFVYENKSANVLPFSYLGQKQVSSSAPDRLKHLAGYSYRVSQQLESANGQFNFLLKDLGVILVLRLNIPAGTESNLWHKVVLSASNATTQESVNLFKVKGYADLFSASEYASLVGEVETSSIALDLADFSKDPSETYLWAYIKVPELTIPQGTVLTCWLYDVEGNAYSRSRAAFAVDTSIERGTFAQFNFGNFVQQETGTNTAASDLDQALNTMDAESTPVKTITIGDNTPKVDAINIPSGVSQSGSSEVNITFQNPVTTTAANTSNTIVVTDNSAANAPVQAESLSDVNLKFAENTGASEVPSLDINLPSSTVTLAPTSGVTHFNVVTTKTARNTLVIKSGVDINKLYVAGGNVVIEAGAHVGEIINSVGAGSTITDWNNGGSTEGSVTATVDGYTSGN